MRMHKPIGSLIAAEAFSITGTRLSTVAVPWLVLVATGSPVLTGVVAMAEMLPYVLLKAVGGPLIDRLGAKRVAVLLDLLSVPVLVLVPILHLLDQLRIPVLIGLVAVLGALRGPADGAKHALVPEVAEDEGVPLERVTGLSGAVERLGSTAGAALAGGLVAALGPVAALGINAITFCISAALLAWGVPAITRLSAEDRGTTRSSAPNRVMARRFAGVRAYVRDLGEGWTYLRGDAVLIGITAMVAVTNLLDGAYTAVLVPVWAEASGSGASAVGVVFAVFSGFAMLGAVIASAWADRLPRLPIYVAAFVLAGLPRFLILGIEASMPIVLITLAVGGFASGFINPILGAVIFERIPKPLRGRVSALNTAICWSLIPFGGLLGGVLIEVYGLDVAFVGCGAAYLLITLMPLVRRSFREFSNRPESEARVVSLAA